MEVTPYEPKNGFLNMLVYGASGTGKTVFAATSPTPLFLDMEGGLLSVAGRVDRAEIKSFGDLKEAYRYLKAGEHKYATVVLDSLTELEKIVMGAVLAEAGCEVPRHGEWNLWTTRMRDIVRAFRDLPMNVVMTALEAEIKDEVSGAVMKRPAMPGRFGFELAGYFDLVLYLSLEREAESGTPVRHVRTVGDERLVAKDRFGKLPPFIESSFPLIYHAIFNQKKVRRLRKAAR